MKQRLILAGVCLLALILGIVIGCVWGNVPFFTIDPQISLMDVLGFLLNSLSLAVTVFIAVNVTKILQSNQAITSYLASELDELIILVKTVHKIMTDAYSAKSFQEQNRDALIHAFYDVELKIDSIESQILAAFPKEAPEIMESLKQAFFTYKNFLTGGEVMLSSFILVSDAWYKDCQTQHIKLETVIKKTRLTVHKL